MKRGISRMTMGGLVIYLSVLLFHHHSSEDTTVPLCKQLQVVVTILASSVFSADYAEGRDFSLKKLVLFIAAYLLIQCPNIQPKIYPNQVQLTTEKSAVITTSTSLPIPN